MTELDRFVQAQDGCYAAVLAELRAGRKRTHWMWFVFPQLAGLGRSPTAQYYAIRNMAEAQEFLAHPVLGARLRECAGIVAATAGRDAVAIFGSVDALKLHSSMTLFGKADPAEPSFRAVLDKYYAGVEDAATLRLLGE